MDTLPHTFSIPAYIATNPSTGICNVYDHLPQRLDNGDYAGNIVLTLGVKGVRLIPDRINYWSLSGIELPKPGTKPIRISLVLDLRDPLTRPNNIPSHPNHPNTPNNPDSSCQSR